MREQGIGDRCSIQASDDTAIDTAPPQRVRPDFLATRFWPAVILLTLLSLFFILTELTGKT